MIAVAALTGVVLRAMTTQTTPAAVALRAALGSGAASILLADDPRLDAPRELLAIAPLIVMRREAMSSPERLVYQTFYTLYAYDDPAIGYGRLDALIGLVADVYADGLTESRTLIEVAVEAGRQSHDATLGLALQTITLIIDAV